MWGSRRLASEARLLLSQVVDRVGRIKVPPPLAAAFRCMYRLTGGSISGLFRKRSTASPFIQASCYSWSSNGHASTTVSQKLRSVPHFLQPPAIDKEPESIAKMYVNQGVTRWRELESTLCVTIISARNTGTWAYAFFSNAVFNHFPLENFSQTNGNRLVGGPKSPFPSNSKSTNSPNFSFKWIKSNRTNILQTTHYGTRLIKRSAKFTKVLNHN